MHECWKSGKHLKDKLSARDTGANCSKALACSSVRGKPSSKNPPALLSIRACALTGASQTSSATCRDVTSTGLPALQGPHARDARTKGARFSSEGCPAVAHLDEIEDHIVREEVARGNDILHALTEGGAGLYLRSYEISGRNMLKPELFGNSSSVCPLADAWRSKEDESDGGVICHRDARSL